jgi:1-acyl-sn-glycerol-3-phosphate acyltransferase
VLGKQPGTITLSIGKPISPEGLQAPELMQAVETWIENEVARLGDPRASKAMQTR